MCIFGDMNNVFNNVSSQKEINQVNVCKIKKDNNNLSENILIQESSKELIDFMTISAQKSSEKIGNKINQLTTTLPFVDNNSGNIKANLKIDIVDKNGFTDSGNQDLKIKLNGNINVKKDVFFESLKKLEGKPVERSWKADADIGKVSFDSKNNLYKIQLKIDGVGLFNDDINLVIKTDSNKNLVMTVEDNWLPDLLNSDTDVLKKVQSKISNELKKQNFGLNAVIKDGKLMFLPKIENKELKINDKESFRIDKTNLDFEHVKFDINKEGNISINFKDLEAIGSNIKKDDKGNELKEKSSGDYDFASFDISANINPKGEKEIIINNGSLYTSLDNKEAEIIKIEGSDLGKHFDNINVKVDNLKGKINVEKSNKINSNISSNIEVKLDKPNKKISIEGNIASKFDNSGNFTVESKNINIKQPNGNNKINDLYIANNKNDGFKFHIKEDEQNLPEIKTKMSKNYIEPIIGTSKYSDKLFQSFDKAKESINVESFLFNGKFAEDITDKLIMKSSGLINTSSYGLKSDNSGVKVKLIFDSSKGDKTEQTHESFNMVKKKVEQFINDVEKGKGRFSSLNNEQRINAIKNVKENMKWKILEEGITKIDHRKEVIIDGKFAFSGGGINLTDSALKKHDTMMEVWGPAVSDIQKEFIENWEEVAGKITDNEKSSLIKDNKTLESAMKSKQKEIGNKKTVNSQILVTDDNRVDTYQKIIEKIKTSKKINIEHAYFTDKKIIDELVKAIKRGAEINVIVPEYSDEGDLLHYGNLGTLLTLKQASNAPDSKGKFNAYLYKWDEKKNTGKFSHTKAMSFDGKSAIVGSTNLTTRSLTGTLGNFLFNKEMSILIEDKDMIGGKNKTKSKRKEEDKGIDETIFERDMSPEFSKKLDDEFFKSLEKEKDKINKYTQLQPLF